MEVKEAYRKMNWNYVSANFNQCREEPNSNSIFKEGCQLYGTMEVNRVRGKNIRNFDQTKHDAPYL